MKVEAMIEAGRDAPRRGRAPGPGRPARPARPAGVLRGLRVKSALALCLSVGVFLLAASAAGWRAFKATEENLSAAFARNATQYNKQRILTPVLRELALAQQFADSEVTRRWLLNEDDAATRALFFSEAERYRRAYSDHSYFIVSGSRRYYFHDGKGAPIMRPSYVLQPGDPDDAWYFSTIKQAGDYSLNVNLDSRLHVTKVWFNVPVRENGRVIGLAGTGLDLTRFLDRFVAPGGSGVAGVTPMFLNRDGDIQAHPDRRLIDYASITTKETRHSTVFQLLDRPRDQRALRDALRLAARDPDSIPIVWTRRQGRRELCAVSYIPELQWYALTSVNLGSARVMESTLWLYPLLSGLTLLAVLIAAIVFGVDRLVLAPLLRLTEAARSVTKGDYSVALPVAGSDEIGELTHSFQAMADRVRSHTEELESTVHARTRELIGANARLEEANQRMGDSIACARLIQNATLPDQEMARALAERSFLIWRPRDVVGGDGCVFRATERGYLAGVFDCAGHGVPGALMAMMARAMLDTAIETLGPDDPAAILQYVDGRVWELLGTGHAAQSLTPHMDAGLAWVDTGQGRVIFAGARIGLHYCDGTRVAEVRGDRHAIGDRRRQRFTNRSLPAPEGLTCYLTTDGLLDQNGGARGFSFGRYRYEQVLQRYAGRSLEEQRDAMIKELAAYQGDRAQRDDITLLAFRVGDHMDTPAIRPRTPETDSEDLA